MKKLIATLAVTALAALAGACHSGPPSTGATPGSMGNATGGTDATSAVRAYLKSVEQQDLQAMGAIWGDASGPARDALKRDELYQREFVMMCALKHDRYDIIGDAPNAAGGRSIVVNLFSAGDSHPHTFDVVQGPDARWYVRSVDVKQVTTCGRG